MCKGIGVAKLPPPTPKLTPLAVCWCVRCRANNGDIDSGLHHDYNGGGFMLQVTGRKDIVLFSPEDSPFVYQNNRAEFQSKLFLARDLTLDSKTKLPDLWKATPYVVTLNPGDVLYTPNAWWHEVYTSGQSVAFSVWVNPPPSEAPAVHTASVGRGTLQCTGKDVFKAAGPGGALDFTTASLAGCSGVLNLGNLGMGDEGAKALEVAFEALADGARLYDLKLHNNGLTDLGAVHVATLLTYPGAKFLAGVNLEDNEIGAEGAKIIASVMEMPGCPLNSLWLSRNQVGDVGAMTIGLAILQGARLMSLKLASNGLTQQSADALGLVFGARTSLMVVDLSGNEFGESGALTLAAGLGQATRSMLAELDVSGCGMGATGAAAVAKGALAAPRLTRLKVGGNGVGDAGASAIAAALAGSRSLMSLDVSDSAIGPVGAAAIAAAIAAHPRLSELDLSGNAIADAGAAALAGAAAQNGVLGTLRLAGNSIGAAGAVAVAGALVQRLTQLDLTGNALGDAGALALAAALDSDFQLTKLKLGSNGIGDTGGLRLAQMLGRNRCLETVHAGDNALTSPTGLRFAAALRANKVVMELDLGGSNSIGNEAGAALAAAVAVRKMKMNLLEAGGVDEATRAQIRAQTWWEERARAMDANSGGSHRRAVDEL